MQDYCERITVQDGPRLPLEGSADLTYRCNNSCRHCWVSIPAISPEKRNELSFDQITRIVDEARGMGCRKWAISGGEPMLRSDFSEIFDYITPKSLSYSLNTNGTLINPHIARLMKRKESKMVAVFNHDHNHVTIYNGQIQKERYGKGDLPSLTFFPTDQIVLSRVLAERGGCYLHSAGVILDNKGLLFVGLSCEVSLRNRPCTGAVSWASR